MKTTTVYWGYIGIMEKKMETTVVYWGYIGIMQTKMRVWVETRHHFRSGATGWNSSPSLSGPL